jgi:methylglyoxal/glyoxal reductase
LLNDISATVTLNNGVKLPVLGLGTWQSTGPVVEQAIKWGVAAGYRHIDTAAAYNNEEDIGRAMRNCGVPRSEIFLTTKVWNEEQRKGPDAVARAFDASLQRLGLDYVDLCLIHWPVKDRYKDTWAVLEQVYASKRARAIGISNFLIPHMDDLLKDAKVVPTVNQLEFHPLLRQQELLDFCVAHKIQHEAWSPLMQGKAGEIPELKQIGARYGKTPEQVTLRWELQKGSVVIPKSANQARIKANAAIFDFELSADEVSRIDALDRGQRFGAHPNTFTF